MRKWLFVMLIAACLLTACRGSPTPGVTATGLNTQVFTKEVGVTQTITPSFTKTPTPTRIALPTQTIIPSDTRIPPTRTITITQTELPVLFRDDFDGVLKEGWRWFRSNSQRWSLSVVPGFLRIILDQGFFGTRDLENMLAREIPPGIFQISTLVKFRPEGNFQYAGLFIYQDAANVVTVGRAFCNDKTACVGNGVYFNNIQDGKTDAKNYAVKVKNESQVYLMLKRQGNIFTAFYSEDGKEWKQLGEHTNNMSPSLAGIAAGQAYDPGYAADFDYFTLEKILE